MRVDGRMPPTFEEPELYRGFSRFKFFDGYSIAVVWESIRVQNFDEDTLPHALPGVVLEYFIHFKYMYTTIPFTVTIDCARQLKYIILYSVYQVIINPAVNWKFDPRFKKRDGHLSY